MRKKENEGLYKIIVGVLLFIIGILIGILYNGGQLKGGDVDVLSFIGSLLGGILSVLGVIFTIRASFVALEKTISEQNKLRYTDTISNKIKALYKVKSVFYETDRKISNWKYGWNDKFEKTDKSILEHEIYVYFFPNMRFLIEDSLEVDYDFFIMIQDFVKSSRSYVFNNDPETKDVISRLDKEINDIIIKLEIHEARLISIYEQYAVTEGTEI